MSPRARSAFLAVVTLTSTLACNPLPRSNALFLDSQTRSGLAHYLDDAQLEGVVRAPFRLPEVVP